MSSAVELQQLTGRLVRICTDRPSQGHVRVCTTLNKGTFDSVFMKHIHVGNMPKDEKAVPITIMDDDPHHSRSMVEMEIQEELTSSTHSPILKQYLASLYKRRRLSR
jgi:hypothetical protein